MRNSHEYPIVKVSFEGSQSDKIYNYWIPDNPEPFYKGDLLRIKRRYDDNTLVKVEGFGIDSSSASATLHIKEIVKPQVPSYKKLYKTRKVNTMTKLDTATASAKDAATTIKDAVIKMQTGRAVMTTLKTTLKESGMVPITITPFLETPYSDLAISLLLKVLADTFTDSEIIQKAAQDTVFVSSVDFSDKFTQIQSLIEATLTKAIAKKETPTNE